MPLLGRRREAARKIRTANPADPRYAQYNKGKIDPQSLTAAAARVTSGKSDELRRLVQPWQQRSFFYYDVLGAINFAAQYYSRGLAQIDLFAGEVKGTTNGVPDIQPATDPRVVEQLERIKDPGGGGRSGLLGAYGRLMFLTGEALLLCTTNGGVEQWEMLSSDELRVEQGDPPRYRRLRAPTVQPEELRAPPDEDFEPLDERSAIVYRIWQRHPQWSGLADATMRGALDTCQEIVGLTQAVRARIRSRLSGAGVLFVDDRVSYGSTPAETGADEDTQIDPLMADIIEAITAPLADEGNAASVAPLLIRIPVPVGDPSLRLEDLFYFLKVREPGELYPELGMLMQSFQRLALELDMPPEILMGTGDVNHWGAWQIDEQSWKAHLQPKADQLVADLTSGFFQPTLRAIGIADPAKYVIHYDASRVINHPNRNQDAKDAFDRITISGEAYRETLGFAETDKPDEKEYLVRLGEKIRDGSLAVYGVPTVRGGDVETAPGEVESAGPASDTSTAKAPPEPPSQTASGNGHLPANTWEAARVAGACEIALARCRELAGNRIRSLAKRDKELEAAIKDVSAGLVAPTLGRAAVLALGEDERSLIRGYEQLVRQALGAFRVDPDTADRITDLIGQHAVRTLYAPSAQLPPPFQMFVAGALALAPAEG